MIWIITFGCFCKNRNNINQLIRLFNSKVLLLAQLGRDSLATKRILAFGRKEANRRCLNLMFGIFLVANWLSHVKCQYMFCSGIHKIRRKWQKFSVAVKSILKCKMPNRVRFEGSTQFYLIGTNKSDKSGPRTRLTQIN